jgi:hypothetical protein
MYATAANIVGPWSDLQVLETDPPSKDLFNTQHDFILPVSGAEATTWVYAGDRYRQWTKRGAARNVFLPLVWGDGAPLLRWSREWKIDVSTGLFKTVPEPR